ncbi:MAG: hypothetical protein ACREMQ_15515, partial [Longimicrobiales bacterium]
MRFLITLLAIAGVLAVLYRAARTTLRLLRRSVDALVARETAELRAQRGDLTGMAGAADARAVARRQRLLALALLCFWMLLLIVPPLTPWPGVLYA